MVDITALAIPDLKLITPKKFGDNRGFFSEVYNARAMAELGIETEFVQDNHSLSVTAGTVRGLHFQTPPHAQGKLVRVVRGGIFDVAVDLRRGSPTYGRHVAVELSAANWMQFWIPPGFAHGFCTLEPNSEVVYKTTDYYSAENDGGIFWADPQLKIAWPNVAQEAVVSLKDARLPRLADFTSPFVWQPPQTPSRPLAVAGGRR
jgi:dTDP-4-dehydrorhamnose 3,5-epimerase